MNDKFIKTIKEVIKDNPNIRLATDEEMNVIAESVEETVQRTKIEHENLVLKNANLEKLHKRWDEMPKDNEKGRAFLLKEFQEFPLESHEVITLKEGVLPEEWVQYVNLNKGEPYSYAVIKATIRMAGYLTIDDMDPQRAWDRTGQIEDLTGFMMGALISTIAKFTPRGDEVRKAWNKYHNQESKGTVNPALWTIKE